MIGTRLGALGSAEKQETPGMKRKMQQSEHFPLSRRLEIHQDITAADEIETGKRRIVDQLLSAEYHTGAKIRSNLELLMAVNPFEKSTQPISRHLLGDTGWIPAAAGERDGFLAGVGGKHLQRAFFA